MNSYFHCRNKQRAAAVVLSLSFLLECAGQSVDQEEQTVTVEGIRDYLLNQEYCCNVVYGLKRAPDATEILLGLTPDATVVNCQGENWNEETCAEAISGRATSEPDFNNVEWKLFCRRLFERANDCRKYSRCFYSCSDRRCDLKDEFKTLESCSPPNNAESECSQYCSDVCRCKNAGCEYEDRMGNCRKGNQVCHPFRFKSGECVRTNAVYAIGGTLCRNYEGRGECRIDEVVLAVNFNGEEFTDSKGITYQSSNDAPPNSGSFLKGFSPTVLGVPVSDAPLYQTYFYGSQNCISYTIQVDFDGSYEIALKVREESYSAGGIRHFSVFLNSREVLPEVDPIAYTGQQHYAFDIIIGFRVRRRNLGNHVNLYVKARGYEWPLSGGPSSDSVLLEICPGRKNCNYTSRNNDNKFSISGFSVVRFLEPGDRSCKGYNNDLCQCLHLGCEYDSARKKCLNKLTSCTKTIFGVAASEEESIAVCHRRGAFYLDRNLGLCKVMTLPYNCPTAKVVQAINLSGRRYKDSNGVTYEDERTYSQYISDPGSLRLGVNIKSNCSSIQNADEKDAENLYSTVVRGYPLKGAGCVSYPVHICQDGRYELSLKTVEDSVTSTNMRRFDVLLNNAVLLNGLDILQFEQSGRPKCSAIEIILLFDVYYSLKKLKFENSAAIDISGGRLELKLCNGDCQIVENAAFQLSAYSVTRIRDTHFPNFSPDSTCITTEADTTACSCKLQGCEYNVVTKSCRERKTECILCDFEVEECRRAEAWYADGGVLCRNSISRGNCILDKMIMAVNLGGPEHTGPKGILYQSYDSAKPIRSPDGIQVLSDSSVQAPNGQVPLYGTFIAANKSRLGASSNADVCSGYDIPITDDGLYELNIKLVAPQVTDAGQRTINYRLNGFHVVEEMDPRWLVTDNDAVLDININFRVTANGLRLELRGHPKSSIFNRKIPFDFCNGKCMPLYLEGRWQISAFSVVKFDESCGAVATLSDVCSAFHNNFCSCRGAGCQYNPGTRQCVMVDEECRECEEDDTECRRKGAYYINGGIICKSSKQRGDCQYSDVLIAVNCNGPDVTDSNGIVHKASIGQPSTAIAPNNGVLVRQDIKVSSENISSEDVELYKTFYWGKDGKCADIQYSITFPSDGDYELSIKTIDDTYGSPGERTISYKLNGIYIVREIDMTKHLGAKDIPMNLIINFKVTGDTRKLDLPGFAETDIANSTIKFEPCAGACEGVAGYIDRSWHIAAFSVIKFGTPKGEGHCSKFNDDVCKCVKENCQYNPVSGDCRIGMDTCKNYFGKSNDCRRENSFYSQTGILCKHPHETGSCSSSSTTTTYAVNLNGEQYLSSDSIAYSAESDLQPFISDPYQVSQYVELECDSIAGVSESDSTNLFKKVLRAKKELARDRRCISFTIPLCRDGRYELSIKTAVDKIHEPKLVGNKTRAGQRFNMRFNNYWIFNEIDVAQYAGGICRKAEFLTLFEVDNEATLLRVHGFPDDELRDFSTTVQFCYSECAYLLDRSFQVAAFSIVRLGDPVTGFKDSCSSFSDSCSCVKAGCTFSRKNDKCSKRKSCTQCITPRSRGGDEDCRRANSFYPDDTTLCRNTIQSGNCNFARVIKAVNLGGAETTSSLGITFESYETNPPISGAKRVTVVNKPIPGNVPLADKPLYETLLLATSKRGDVPCLAYDVVLDGDGKYELSLKTWEHEYKQAGQRTIRFEVNGVLIVPDLDMALVAGANEPVDIIVGFEVSGRGTVFHATSFDERTDIVQGTFTLRFCNGNCTEFPDHAMTIAAFSIIKY